MTLLNSFTNNWTTAHKVKSNHHRNYRIQEANLNFSSIDKMIDRRMIDSNVHGWGDIIRRIIYYLVEHLRHSQNDTQYLAHLLVADAAGIKAACPSVCPSVCSLYVLIVSKSRNRKMNEKIDPRIITRNDTGQKEINKKKNTKFYQFTPPVDWLAGEKVEKMKSISNSMRHLRKIKVNLVTKNCFGIFIFTDINNHFVPCLTSYAPYGNHAVLYYIHRNTFGKRIRFTKCYYLFRLNWLLLTASNVISKMFEIWCEL